MLGSSGAFSAGMPVGNFLSSTARASAEKQSRLSGYVTAKSTSTDPAPSPGPIASLLDVTADDDEILASSSVDPWPTADSANKRLRKGPPPLVTAGAGDDDDEDSAEDQDYDGHSSDSEASGAEKSDADSGMSDYERHANEQKRVVVADAPVSTAKRPKQGHADDEAPVSKATRPKQRHAEQFRKLQLETLGRIEDDDDDEDDGESLGSDDDEDDEDEDDIEYSDDGEGFVRDDAQRLQEALSFKVTLGTVNDRIDRKLVEFSKGGKRTQAELAAERKKVVFSTVLGRIAEFGADVNRPLPDLDDSGPGEKEDEQEEESPIHKLIVPLMQVLDRDESDLTELTAKLCRAIFGKSLVACQLRNPASLDLGKELQVLWNNSGNQCQLFSRCREMVQGLVGRTENRICHRLMLLFAGAFDSGTSEFAEIKVVVDRVSDRAAMPYACASCAGEMVPEPLQSDSPIVVLPAIELVQRRSVALPKKGITIIQCTPSRVSKATLNDRLLLCGRCRMLVPLMNQLLTVPIDIMCLTRMWIASHMDEVSKPKADSAGLCDAFHQWEPRRNLCTSIIWAYKILHAIALD